MKNKTKSANFNNLVTDPGGFESSVRCAGIQFSAVRQRELRVLADVR